MLQKYDRIFQYAHKVTTNARITRKYARNQTLNAVDMAK
ncbi:hypothetical protein HMPREF1144_0728 [Klebsiella sp. OBRC7]|nr:hypothetical protein HMPREF1144_0728 [Klebsiella sp. OBRC7]